jgi:hypothetical protein
VILDLPSYKTASNQYKPQLKLPSDLVKRLYNDLSETGEYKKYISQQSREKKEKDMLDLIFNDIILPSELFRPRLKNFSIIGTMMWI